MSRIRRCETLAAIAIAAGLGTMTVIDPSASARADDCVQAGTAIVLPLEIGVCADVLAQEARWLTAITEGDVATVEQILGPGFKHINADGALLDRDAEIAGLTRLPFTMNAGDQRVDIAGDTAVIHGVNTMIQDDKVIARERFTDVFVLRDGRWMALSAQETKIE
nr:nuclear transport factor 2 family protein [Mycolicibacterium komanii]CRL69123.1 hypothetical protein CPGR_01404 [Mycolicibacterium komanii]